MAHKLALSIHNTRLLLEANGYSRVSFILIGTSLTTIQQELSAGSKFPRGPGLDVEEMKKIEAQVAKDLQDWNSLIEEISREAPRLYFLNSSSLGQLLVVLREVLNPTNMKDQSKLFSAISPFLWICFPELLSTHENKSLKTESVYSCLKGAYDKIGAKAQVLSQMQVLEVVRIFFTKLNELVLEESYVTHGNQCLIAVYLITGERKETRATPKNLFVATVKLAEADPLPHSSCILRCTPTTSESTILRFIRASESFPYLTFQVLEVNSLNIHLRNQLLVELVRLDKERSAVKLNLVFTERQGIEPFSFLKKPDLSIVELNSLPINAPKIIQQFKHKNCITKYEV